MNTSHNDKEMTIHQRAEKIVAALYMVTDHMDGDDALRKKTRNAAIDIMDMIHKNKDQKTILSYGQKLQSFFGILLTTGQVSDMNYKIIHAQIQTLLGQAQMLLPESSTSNTHESIQQMFDLEDTQTSLPEASPMETESTSDNKGVQDAIEKKTPQTLPETTSPVVKKESAPISHSVKDTVVNKTQDEVKKSDTKKTEEPIVRVTASPEKKLVPSYQNFLMRKAYTDGKPLAQKKVAQPVKPKPAKNKPSDDKKNNRHNTILELLQDNSDVSITDICDSFTDCSSKTIQRDLNELIDEGKVIKKGSRRWSTYSLA